MIERVRTGLVTAIVAAAAFGALAAPVAEAATGPTVAAAASDGGPTGKPKTDCIWMWTVKGPVCHWQ